MTPEPSDTSCQIMVKNGFECAVADMIVPVAFFTRWLFVSPGHAEPSGKLF
jgi:hypothetical protein